MKSLSREKLQCLANYLSYWPKITPGFKFEQALQDSDIAHMTKQQVVADLRAYGWIWDDERQELIVQGFGSAEEE